jgi:hypothetical protein
VISGNTYPAKFKKQDLQGVQAGDAVTLTTKGEFHKNREKAVIQANDTVKVTQ